MIHQKQIETSYLAYLYIFMCELVRYMPNGLGNYNHGQSIWGKLMWNLC